MLGTIAKFCVGVVVGGIIGVAAASLLTPKSGDAIREDLRMGFDEIRLDYEQGKQKKLEELDADLKRRCGEL